MPKNDFRRTSHQEPFYAATCVRPQDHQVDVLISRIFDDLFLGSPMSNRPNNSEIGPWRSFCGFNFRREFLETPLGLFNQILRDRYSTSVDGMSHQLIQNAMKKVQFGVAKFCFVSGNLDDPT